jgi:signal transduction histidine kinase
MYNISENVQIAVSAIIGITLVGFMLIFFIKASQLQREISELKIRHGREIEAIQKEILRQSLEEISRELHDDFGQRLSLVKLRLNAILADLTGDAHASLTETKEMTGQLLQDLKNLTRYLYINSSKDIQLPEVIGEELSRVNRSGLLATSLNLKGIPRTLDAKTSLVVFRMFQESLNNVVAHSQARNCEVLLHYDRHDLVFRICDDGIGFTASPNPISPLRGLGLKNLARRSTLINARLYIESAPAKGTTISIRVRYPIKRNIR